MEKRPEVGYESLSLGDYQERLMNKLVSKKFLPAIETYARRNGGSWVCVWSASFFPISSGRCLAWQPPASNARQVAFDSNPNMASLGFSPFHPSLFSSFPFFFLTFLPSFGLYLPTYLSISLPLFRRVFLQWHHHQPINQNSLQQATRRKSPTRWSALSI